ncbi:MAG: hypothetical protein Q4F41_09375 [Eubacteriales bacterium]|nr:hypothetical protein [Eubacteriales bacterium]
MRAIMDIYEVRIITNMGNEEIWIYMDEDCKAIVTLGCIDGYEILNYRTPMGIDVITHGELPLRLTLV